MDPRLLTYYERELQYLREMGGEFASEFPKIAGRLGLDGFDCADPYVERLLEGFSFLAGRVQLKLDAQFPVFTQHLLEMVYPHYLAPVPSMAVVQFQPDLNEGSLAEGFPLDRQTVLRSPLGEGEQTACEYRTAHDVKLWPLELAEVEYFSRDVASLDVPELPGVQAGLRLRLKATAGLTFDQLALDRLPLHLRGSTELPMHVYEQLLANAVAVVVRPSGRPVEWQEVLKADTIRALGFDDPWIDENGNSHQIEEALFPYGPPSFHGYRLLQEYFVLPARFMFVEFGGLASAVRRCQQPELELIVLLDRRDNLLENRLTTDDFALFCTPAINLFPLRADRIHLDPRHHEHHIVPDRIRPMDFEVHRVTQVVGYGTGTEEDTEFLPFYALTDRTNRPEHEAFYTTHRVPRLLSTKQRQYGARSGYVGSEVFLSLVDARQAPYHHDLRQLGLNTLCTNRDLPFHLPVGLGSTDFLLQASAPVQAVRCVAGPTKPRPSPVHAEGDFSWRLISHLSLNYLSLLDNDQRRGAAALRELLDLYADTSESVIRKQVEGVRSVTAAPAVRRIGTSGALAFGRGLEIALTFDESAFEGAGVFLLGAVLERFFAKYTSINSFTETVVSTLDRGEIIRWPARCGTRQIV